MTRTHNTRCSLVSEGVEVFTSRDEVSGEFVSTIHGGDLDGDEFKADPRHDLDDAHDRACRFARLAGPGLSMVKPTRRRVRRYPRFDFRLASQL